MCRLTFLTWAGFVPWMEVQRQQQLSIQDHHGCTINPLRPPSKHIIKRTNFGSINCNNETKLSIYQNYSVLNERKNIVQRQSLPFTIEPGFTDDDDNITTLVTNLYKQLNVLYRFSRPHTIIGTVSLTYN